MLGRPVFLRFCNINDQVSSPRNLNNDFNGYDRSGALFIVPIQIYYYGSLCFDGSIIRTVNGKIIISGGIEYNSETDTTGWRATITT